MMCMWDDAPEFAIMLINVNSFASPVFFPTYLMMSREVCVSLQYFKHLGGSKPCDRVMPLRSQLHHRNQKEIAVGKMRMWHLQHGQVNNHVINSHNIDIHQAVNIATFFISMGSAAHAPLNNVDAVEHFEWRDITDDPHTHIHEMVTALKSPGLALNKA